MDPRVPIVMSTRFHVSTALLMCSVSVACELGRGTSGTAARDAWTGTERDSAGVRIVSNPSTGIWTEYTRWIVERDLSIGMVDGPPEYEFGRVQDVAVGKNGSIYVLDQQAAQIRVFDSEGSHLFSFGRAGRGPGELSSSNPMGARAVLMTRAGELLVPDFDNQRVTRFSANGEVIGSFPVRLGDGVPVASSIFPSGDYVVHRVRRSAPSWNGLLRIDQDGTVLDTILEFDLHPSPWGISTQTSQGRREALSHSPLWEVMPDGRLISGTSEQYLMEVRGLDGRLEMVVEKQQETPTLSREEQERFLDRLLELWAEAFRVRGDPEERIQSQLRQGRDIYILPERLPAFTGFAGGPEGTIWVRGVLPIDSMTAHILQPRPPLREFWSSRWEVFSRTGRFLGEVILPTRFTLFKIRDPYIYGMERDELGVERVVRLRIRVR